MRLGVFFGIPKGVFLDSTHHYAKSDFGPGWSVIAVIGVANCSLGYSAVLNVGVGC